MKKIISYLYELLIVPPKDLARWIHIIVMLLQLAVAAVNVVWMAVLYSQNLLSKLAFVYFGANALFMAFAFVAYASVYYRRYVKDKNK